MRFVFFPINCCPFHGRTLEERPIGGTETAIIRLSEALYALGQEVFVVTSLKSYPMTRPIYVPPSLARRLEGIDILIIIRGLEGVLFPITCKRRFFWTGDAWTNRHTYGLGDWRYAKQIDSLLAVSEWHAKTLCESSGFPSEKTFILRNGVKLSLFEGEDIRRRKRLIYSSNPSRGLMYLPVIYQELKKKHPGIELHIFSSPGIYSRTWPPKQAFEEESETFFNSLRKLPHCYSHGGITQGQLAKEFKQSAIWVYPTNFEESSCITAMEAQAAGCVAVTTNLAALEETVGDAGILIDERPTDKNYLSKYVEACDRLLADDALFSRYSTRAKERAQSSDWKRRAEELLNYISQNMG